MNVAFIPVRGGSKSIPLKNIKPICGKPLVYWTVKAACGCKAIDAVYVATDSEEIKAACAEFAANEACFSKLRVIGRSAESATDTASTEFAMLEFAQAHEFDNIVLIQATSPMLTAEDLDGGFSLFGQYGVDSVMSVVRQYRFIWDERGNGIISPGNYDVYNRPRRQEFKGFLMENGAFYICSRADLLKTKNRVSGSIAGYEMCEESAFEIDEPADWVIIESLMKKRGMDKEACGKSIDDIKMFLTDCDGCLTDGGMYYTTNGDEIKKFNAKDGMAFRILREHGIVTGMITGEDVELNRRRASKIKMDIYEPGCEDKLAVVKRICSERGICLDEVCYVGDDINDLDVIKAVGLGCAPANALDEVKAAAKLVTTAKGGECVVREVVERLLGHI